MKNAKILSVIAVFVIIAGISAKFFMPSLFYGYIYPFSRIKGSVSITVDGKNIPLSDCKISCIHQDKKEKAHVIGSKLSTRAGKYGRYKFIIEHDGIEIPFYFYQSNCWNCEKFELSFSVDTEKRTISCTGWTRGLDEKGFKEEKLDIVRTITFDDISPEGIGISSV